MRYYAAILSCFCALGQVPGTPQIASPDAKPDAKCSIEGTVVNSVTGEPVKKARVFLVPLDAPRLTRYATSTNGSGHFLLNEVDPGRYQLEGYRAGYSASLATFRTFTLESGQEVKDVALKLTPTAVVNGRILDEDGDPVSNATVDCMRVRYIKGVRQLLSQDQATTNDAGDFRLSISTAGKCAIRATPPSKERYPVRERPIGQVHGNTVVAQQEYVATYLPPTTNPSSASSVEVTPGAQISGINITLMRGVSFHIRGRVKPAATVNPARTFVQLFGWDSFAIVDSKGGFQFNDVAPGSYSLHALQVLGDKRYSVSVPIHVVDQNIEGIELVPQPPARIEGRVVFEEKSELKGMLPPLVFTATDGMDTSGAQVQDDLTFRADVTPGSYKVGVEGASNTYIKHIRVGEQDVTETGFDVPLAAGDLMVFLSQNAGIIEGAVKNAKDEPAPNVTVTLIPEGNQRTWLHKFTITDQNGHFKIEGIVPREYKIYAWEEIEEGAYEDPDFIKLHESQGQKVSIKESSHENVNLKLIAADSGQSSGAK